MEIRPACPEDVTTIAEIHYSCWQEVYDFMPAEVLKSRDQDYRLGQWNNWFMTRPINETLLVLTEGNTVTGFALSKPNSDPEIPARGEMHAGYILPDYRGGISAPVMMRELANTLKGAGLWPACIWAFQENRYRRFYTALGWQPKIRRNRILAGHPVPEIGYLSQDHEVLINRLNRMIASVVKRQTQQSSQVFARRMSHSLIG